MELTTKITLRCVFCFSSSFDLPEEDYEPSQGEMILCHNCGRWNDYGSLHRIAKRKGMEWVEEQAALLIEKELKKMFKGFRK